MRKIMLIFASFLMACTLSAAADPVKSSFNIEFTKNGVYEFAFYKSADSTNEIHYLVFSPVDPDIIGGTYKAAFGVKWNIQSPLDYVLSLEFSSSTSGSTATDYMLKYVGDKNIGLNFSYDVKNGTSTVLESNERASAISLDRRTAVIKNGKAAETERNGSADITLTLDPPGDGGYSAGQYLGYIRMILTVG